MSLPARKFVKSKRTGSQSRRAVLNCIADWMIGDSTVECWPTVENIVFDTEMNPQTVSKVTKELVELGFITKRRKFNTEKRRWETHYTLVGFSPAEWVNAPWPTAYSCQEPTGNTAHGKSYAQEPVPTETRELEPTGNRGLNPPENRSRTGIGQEYKQEQTCTSMCPSVGDEPPFPSAELWPDLLTPDSENPAPPEEQAPTDRARRKAGPSAAAAEKSKSEGRTHGTRFSIEALPDDWREFCEREDPELDPERVFVNFADYWRSVSGAKGVKKDWAATWRNDVRRYRNAPSWVRDPRLRDKTNSRDDDNQWNSWDPKLR